MKRIIAYCCFYLTASFVFAQTGNPFELFRDSIPEVHADTILTDITANETTSLALTNQIESVQQSQRNPFEVDTTRQDIVKKPIFRPLEKKTTSHELATNKSETFLFWFILLALVLIALGITRDRKSFSNLYKLISNNNYLKLVNRDLNGGKLVFYVILYTVFFLTLTVFVYQYVSIHYEISGFSFFIRVLGIVLLIYLIRHIAMFIAGKLSLTTQLLSDYNFLIVISNILCGLALFPIVILISYSSMKASFLYLGLGIIAICYIIRQGNGIIAALKEKQANLFHFFIYICTFEIAPALFIIKLIQGYSGAI